MRIYNNILKKKIKKEKKLSSFLWL